MPVVMHPGAGAPVVVGSVNVDRVTRVDRFPSPGETIIGRGPTVFVGGKGANQAAAIAQLIGRCTFVGAIGDDADGAHVVRQLKSKGVDTAHLRTDRLLPTGSANITVDSSGENTIVIHPGANASAVPSGLAVPVSSVLVVSLEIGVEAALRAIRDVAATIILNASPAQPLPAELLDRSDVVIVNETELALMPEVARAAALITTLGPRGADISRNGTVVANVAAPVPARIGNSVGAGDAFCGAVAAALTAGIDLVSAASLACAVGSAAVEQEDPQAILEPLWHYADGTLDRSAPEETLNLNLNARNVN